MLRAACYTGATGPKETFVWSAELPLTFSTGRRPGSLKPSCLRHVTTPHSASKSSISSQTVMFVQSSVQLHPLHKEKVEMWC
ncbi:hypothetical protein NDU88_005158 [Pleurodeles waltl]|uniref:Uncharacterized protein n=1 Tax=Pleurodeles waltl TaxID=8319 RepID=A0AAV7TTJ1_PLEWA|nr:hypothetical protein NDU88_005158 [Pleurodeles waltl]